MSALSDVESFDMSACFSFDISSFCGGCIVAFVNNDDDGRESELETE
jgi:hypothetical protein